MTNIEVTTCYSNKFKNKKTPNHNDVFSMKAGQIETQHNAEKQKETIINKNDNSKFNISLTFRSWSNGCNNTSEYSKNPISKWI